MSDGSTGWAGLAAVAVIRLLAADDVMAGTGPRDRGTVRPDVAVAERPDAGTARARRIVVSIPDRKLAVVEAGVVLRLFDVSVGAPSSPSPVGTFTVVTRLENPTYYGSEKVIGPGPSNPLGTRWLGLSLPHYGIHGTDKPSSIGHARSHGCIRLRNQDVEALFPLVRAGDVVELHAERPAGFEEWEAGTEARPH